MKLCEALLAGIGVLFVIKVLIVVHVPAHFLLVFHWALMQHIGQSNQTINSYRALNG